MSMRSIPPRMGDRGARVKANRPHRRVDQRLTAGSPWAPPPGSWASSEAIRLTMLKCRNRDSRPELALRSAVHRLGRRFLVARRPVPDVKRTADLVFTRAHVAVYLDGCFWHACPRHFVSPKTNSAYWESKISGNVARDRDTDARLAAAGWTVVRIWEHEDTEGAALRVTAVVDAARHAATLSVSTASR